jgi:hypothetical protein
MASSARVHWKPTADQVLEVEVSSDSASPDILDDITHRADYLLSQAVAATQTAATTED